MSSIYDHLEDYIINGECYNFNNGVDTSCQCITEVDNNLNMGQKLLEAIIQYTKYNITNIKLY